MVEATLMAAAPLCRASFQPEQPGGFCKRAYKDFQNIRLGNSPEVPRSGCLLLRSNHFDNHQNASTLSFEFNQPAVPVPSINNPVLIDVQDARPDSVLFSFGIAEQCERHGKILRFLTSGSTVFDGGDLNFSVLSDLMGLHTLSIDMNSLPHTHFHDDICLYEPGNDSYASFVYPQTELYSLKTLTDFVDDFSFYPMAMVHPKSRVLLTGTETEMKDLLAMIADFYLAKESAKGIQRRQMVVPYFRRSSRKVQGGTLGSLSFQDVAATIKSPEEIKLRELPKKKQSKKAGREKEIHRNNYSYICESLLSVVLFKNPDKIAFISLKKNSHELFQLLTQFSAGIAGTGLAVLFSVVWKLGNGRVPFCTARVLNTGLALGLFCLSFSVNTLRDTIIETTKKLNNMKVKEDEIMVKVERSSKEVFVRAAAVMAVVILRFV